MFGLVRMVLFAFLVGLSMTLIQKTNLDSRLIDTVSNYFPQVQAWVLDITSLVSDKRQPEWK